MRSRQGGDTALSRRQFLTMAAASGGAALLAACGGGTAATPTAGGAPTTDAVAPTTAAAPTAAAVAEPTTSAAPTVAASGGQVTIEWANGWSSAVTQEVLPLIVADFEKTYPNVKVKYENPGPSQGYTEGILARLASGSPPDVFYMTSTPTEYAARGSLVDISDYMTSAKYAKPDAFFAGPIASCQWQGKTYGLPTSAGASAIYSNVSLFKQKNISSARADFPKTWDDTRRISKEFLVSDGGSSSGAICAPICFSRRGSSRCCCSPPTRR